MTTEQYSGLLALICAPVDSSTSAGSKPDGMPSSPAETDEYVEYFSGSGAITCRVLYRTEQLAFVQVPTVDWPGFKVALFSDHLRPA